MRISVASFLSPYVAIDSILVVIVEFLGEREIGEFIASGCGTAIYCSGCVRIEYVVYRSGDVFFQFADENVTRSDFGEVSFGE